METVRQKITKKFIHRTYQAYLMGWTHLIIFEVLERMTGAFTWTFATKYQPNLSIREQP